MAELKWVLLVEDEEDHRVLVRTALERMEADVPCFEADSGEKALTWLKRQVERLGPLTDGLVILDLGLPGISGFEVLQEMREITGLKSTPVVILTASENSMDQDHAFNFGARGFFQKPTDFRDYQGILERLLPRGAPADNGSES